MTYDGANTLTYDAENRIVSVDAGATATYIYDANGYRVRQTGYLDDTCDHTGIRDFGYNIFGEQTLEHGANAQGCRWEIYAGGRHIATYAGETIFNHADWLGTERYRSFYYTTNYHVSCASLPFGDALSCSGVGLNYYSPMHFSGRVSGFVLANPELNKVHDFETGLDNFGARYLASSMGRFMTVEPENAGASKDDPQSWNMYSYVDNNPILNIDPDGLDHCTGAPGMTWLICQTNGGTWVLGNEPKPHPPAIIDHICFIPCSWIQNSLSQLLETTRSRIPPPPQWLLPSNQTMMVLGMVSGFPEADAASDLSLLSRDLDVSIRNLKHISAHLGEFKALDPSLNLKDVAEMGKDAIGPNGTQVGPRVWEKEATIGGKSVTIRAVKTYAGKLRTVYIKR